VISNFRGIILFQVLASLLSATPNSTQSRNQEQKYMK
jgi:hypothetical protein